MSRLDTKIAQSVPAGKRIKVVSFASTLPGRKPKKTVRGLSLYEFKTKD